MISKLSILLPAALLALLVFWCGTFQGAVTAAGAIAHQAAVLLFCLLAPDLRDPLGLGRRGQLLLGAALVGVAVSWWISPVGRAGLVGLVLLPAYLLIPSSCARCWRQESSHRLGLASLSILTLTVGLVALIRWLTLSLPRASLPLGHHNLLAGWLVLVLPVALVGVLYRGLLRWLAIAAGVTGVLTIVATQSLLGAAVLVVQGTVAALWWKRLRPWLLAGIFTLAALALPRTLAITGSTDLSAMARASYIEAGWRGIQARPGLGWGPGAVPWTVGEFMRPEAGVHPASQVVADLHSLPVQLAYEVGVTGALSILAISVVFFLRRRSDEKDARASETRQAALLGLLGGAIFALGAAPLAVPALPATAMVVAGLTLKTGRTAPGGSRLSFLLTYLVVATVVLLPLDRAHRHYDRARTQQDPRKALRSTETAHGLDPEFPLYLARAAWLATDLGDDGGKQADRALESAELAPAVAPLWLAAGDLGRRADRPWAPAALERAHNLDPLSPVTAFHLMTVSPPSSDMALRLGETALTAEPRLVAASWWWDHSAMASRIGRRMGTPIPQPIGTPSGQPVALALTLDRTPALSFSLFAFRRSPWPGRLASIALRGDESTTPNTSDP